MRRDPIAPDWDDVARERPAPAAPMPPDRNIPLRNAFNRASSAEEQKREQLHSQLMNAVKTNNAFLVSSLLKEGAPLDRKDENGETARDWAVKNGNQRIVTMIDAEETARMLVVIRHGVSKKGGIHKLRTARFSKVKH